MTRRAPTIRGGVGESRAPPGRHPQGQGRVRLLVGPVGRRDAVGRDAAQPAPARAHPRDRHRAPRSPCRGVHAVLTHEDVPGPQDLRARDPRPAGARLRRGALPGRAGGDRRRRPPRDRAPRRVDRSRSTTRCSSRSTDPERALDPTRRRCTRRGNLLRHVPHPPRRPGAAEADVVVSGEYEVGMQDQAFLGPESGPRGAGRGRRRRPLHRHPVAARRPRPGRGLPRPAAREGAAHARRRRRRVRRARGPLDADPRLPARAAHRPAGEDDVRARGVVLRPRPPPPGADALRARRDARRRARLRHARGSCSTAAPTRRARPPCARTPPAFARGPVRGAERARSTPTSSTPTTRRAARCAASAPCRRASRTRRRWTSWPPRSSIDPVELRLPQRDGDGHGACRPAQPIDCPAPVAELLERVRDAAAARRPSERRARRASPTSPTARACGAASATPSASRTSASPRASTTTRPRACGCRWRAASRWSRCTPRPPRSARGSSRCRSRSRAPSSASSTCVVLPADTQVGSAGSSSASRQTLHDRRRGAGGLRGGARGARRARGGGDARRAARRRPDRGDARVPPPPDHPARRERARATRT